MFKYIIDMESGRFGFMLEGLNIELVIVNINIVIFRGVWLNWSFLIGYFIFFSFDYLK